MGWAEGGGEGLEARVGAVVSKVEWMRGRCIRGIMGGGGGVLAGEEVGVILPPT